jgi:anti-anti-sigma factor
VPEVSPAAADKPEDGEIVVPLVGDLTFETVDALQEQLWDLMDAGCRLLILDAAELEFIDSGGLGLLLRARLRMHARDGRLLVRGLGGQPARVLHTTGSAGLLTGTEESDPEPAGSTGIN